MVAGCEQFAPRQANIPRGAGRSATGPTSGDRTGALPDCTSGARVQSPQATACGQSPCPFIPEVHGRCQGLPGVSPRGADTMRPECRLQTALSPAPGARSWGAFEAATGRPQSVHTPVLRSSTTVGGCALLRTGCGSPCQPSQPAPQVSAHCATQRIAGEASSEQPPWAGAPERHRRPALQFRGNSARPRSPARHPRDPSPRRTFGSHPRSAPPCIPPLIPARGAHRTARPCRSIE
jgi:hypothetical protein